MMTRLRNYFLTGVVVIAPIAITAYLAWTFIHWVDDWVKPLIPAAYLPESYLPFAIPGFGLLVALIIITFVGFLAAGLVGRTIFHAGERLLNRMPLIRNIYRGLKQIFETILANRSELFTRVGLFEYPRRGAWSIVFMAKHRENEIHDALFEKEGRTIAVFRPITPNVTTGYVLYVPEKDVIPLSMTVEDAAKLLISAGLVGPQYEARTRALAEEALAARDAEAAAAAEEQRKDGSAGAQ